MLSPVSLREEPCQSLLAEFKSVWNSPRNLGVAFRTVALVTLASGVALYATGGTQLSSHPPVAASKHSDGKSAMDLNQLREAVRTSPESFPAHMDLGIALSDAGHWEAALAEFVAALQLQPSDPQATYDLGLTHLKMAQGMGEQRTTAYYEQLDAAQQTLLDALRLNPTLPHIHEHLGWLYHEIGDQETAIREFRTEVTLNPSDGEAYNNLGTALAQSQDYNAAILAYEKALAFIPGSASAAINWESAIRRAGKKVEALTDSAAKVKRQPNSAVAHLQYGMVLALNDRQAEAVVQFRAALHLRPKLSVAHFYLGEICYQQQDTVSAEREYRLAIKDDGDRADFLGSLAVLLMAENRNKEAEDILREALRLQPKDSSLLYNLGRALQKLGDKQQALQEFAESSRLKDRAQKEGQVAMLLQRGIQNLRAGDFLGASGALQEALTLDPNHPETNYYLGIALSQVGDMKASAEAFERALERRPESAEIHYNFGIALWQHGRSTEAVREFRRATGIRPDDGLAHCALGLALVRSGDSIEGNAEVARAQSLGACRSQNQ
jgi:tetratricopeptide (TPR) repeat protein